MRITFPLVVGMAAYFAAAHSSSAFVLMFDWGPTTVADASVTNSPYHTETPSFTDASWNKLTNADSGSLVYSDGTAASGVNVNLGRNTTSSLKAINLSSEPSQTNAGTTVSSGVYAGSSVGQDLLHGFNGTDGSNKNIGVQFTGLAAGEYDVYVISRQTFSSLAHGMQVSVGTGSSGNFDFSAYTNETLSYAAGATSATTAWVDGENYLKFRISLTAGQALNIGIYGLLADGVTNDRAALNAIQIVSVPEPGVPLLLGLAGWALLLHRRRKSA